MELESCEMIVRSYADLSSRNKEKGLQGTGRQDDANLLMQMLE